MKKYNNLILNSELLDYISLNHNLSNVSISYDSRYDSGSFTTSIPAPYAKNTTIINGYPHFEIPNEVLLKEIDNYLRDKPLYNNKIVVRYGDTHPNKPVPFLAQTRNLYINEIINRFLTTYDKKENVYLIGDISIGNIGQIAEELGLDPDYFFKEIINGNEIDNPKFKEIFELRNQDSKKNINKLLQELNLSNPRYVMESTLYKDKELYSKIKNDIACEDNLKKNGEIKYSLQELVYAYSFLKSDTTFISLIGSSQDEHIKNVYNIINGNNLNIDYNFLIYGICKNGKERDYNIWIPNLEKKLSEKYKNIELSSKDFLRLLFCGSSNNREIDFNVLDNFDNIFKKYLRIIQSINTDVDKNKMHNDSLIRKMAMANYYIDLSIRKGDQHIFFDYVSEISNSFINNNNLTSKELEMFKEFINKSLNKLNIDNINCRGIEKCKKRF